MVTLYGSVCWLTFSWYTGLADPTGEQTTFASVIWGAAAVWFGFYANTGKVEK